MSEPQSKNNKDKSLNNASSPGIKMTRRAKFFITLIIVAVSVFLVVQSICTVLLFSSNRQANYFMLVESGKTHARIIAERLNSMGERSISFSKSAQVITLLKEGDETKEEDVLGLLENLNEPFFEGVALCGLDSEQGGDAPFYLNNEYAMYNEAVKNHFDFTLLKESDAPYVINMFVLSDKVILVSGVTVKDGLGNKLGYAFRFYTSELFVLPCDQNQEYFIIFNNYNNFVYSSNLTNYEDLQEYLEQNNSIKNEVLESQYWEIPLFYTAADGTEMMSGMAKLTDSNFVVAYSIPKADVMDNAMPFLVSQIIATVVGFLVLVAVLTACFFVMDLPVTNVIDKCLLISMGETDEFILTNYKDAELNKLGRIFNTFKTKLEDMAFKDYLLKIGTRQKYFHDMEMLIRNIEVRTFRMFLIDIKEFGKYNEVLSNEVGDKILMETAVRLQSIFSRWLYRIDGDVFLGIISGYSDIDDTCRQIHETMNTKVQVANMDNIEFACRVAVCSFPSDGKTSAGLLECAQTAMHQAKSMNVDQLIYHSDMLLSFKRDEEILSILKRSIANGTMEVWYQPIYHLKAQKYISAEALVRLKDETGEIIPTIEVIRIAEENNVIDMIGDYVLKRTCQTIKLLEQFTHNIDYIQVNLSIQQLVQKSYAEKAMGIIQEMGVSPKQLGMEVTETMVIKSVSGTIDTLNKLRNFGVRIAMDDFGSGYSGISYMAKLPIDILKLDKELVQTVKKSESELQFVKTVVQLAKIKNLTVVAEGVETKDVLEKIENCNVDCIQGYYYSKAIQEDDFIQFVLKNYRD